MQLTEVTNAALARAFIKVNVVINKANTGYIRPLDKDVEEVFDEKKNKTFRQGSCARWILQDAAGNLVGRIAAFTNKKYKNKGDDIPVGGVGFFDCIHDQQTANLLFDTARQWLAARGMEAMDGPINFGERDRWWGLVVEGFQEPMYCMNYNYPYYQDLFENYGFKNFFNQLCFGLDAEKKLHPKMYDRHALYANDPDYSCLHIKKNQLEKFSADFAIIYNKAWAGHGGLKELKKEQVFLMFKKMKPVIDEKIIWFAYYREAPVCMFVNLPDLNQYFKHLNGKFGLVQKLYFLWLQKTMRNKKFTGIVYGIIPEFQGKGVDAYMIVEAAKVVQPTTSYKEYEMQWIGEFNPKMVNVAQGLGETFRSRMLTTYRYVFDRNRPFKRHPVVN
ncbi:MAG: hypothetical protein ABI813_06590 [Bacteroidota bacterium]